DCASACAERSASFTAASTMSSSSSGSSGSIAFGSILISLISPAPVALTVTMPPPAEASTVSCASSSCTRAICSCICCACLSRAFMSKPPLAMFLFVHLSRVEGLLEQRHQVLLGRRRVLFVLLRRALLAEDEEHTELPAGHLIQRLAKNGCVLGVLGQP